MKQGRISIEQFDSRILKKNPLGDPSLRRIPVYLPPSYDDSKRFPVIYMLAGFASTGVSYLNYTFGKRTLPEQIDDLIARKKMPEVIVVMPDGMTRYGGSQYLNSSATGRYRDHLIKELIPYIDRTFKTLGNSASRAVMGKSSGGYGALRLAMAHPETFGAAACHSGDMNFDLCYSVDFPPASRVLERHDFSLKKFFTSYEAAPKKPRDGFPLINMIGMAAAYSPNPKKKFPENYDLPFDPYTCEKIPAVWKKWLSNDPIHLIGQKENRQALKQLNLLFIDCGTNDEYHLQFGARLFSQKLKKLGITHIHEEFPDSHSDTAYRYDVSLPLIAEAIS
jgi:S-formylglutathione hydrolase FrmB